MGNKISVHVNYLLYDSLIVLFWYILLIIMLYIVCRFSVVMVILMLFIDFDYYMFAIFEFYTILFFVLVANFRSSYERGSANIFIIFFGFVLRFRVVISNGILIIRLILVILGLAKLPLYRLHI